MTKRTVLEVLNDIVSHVSEKPWSEYTEADYSVEQYHAACLIHLHVGPPTSKSECKLPVKTPSGAINRNGVHAAAAALAGARGGVKASPEQKAKARSALTRLYSQLDESPPASLAQSAMDEDVLEHFGVKGMKWGVRRSRSQLARAGGKSVKDMSDEDLRKAVNRMNMEQQYSKLSSGKGGNKNKSAIAAGATFVGGVALNIARSQIQNQANQKIGRAIAQRTAREAAVKRLKALG